MDWKRYMHVDPAQIAEWQEDSRIARLVARKLNCKVAAIPSRVANLLRDTRLFQDDLEDAQRRLNDQAWRDNPPQGSL